MSAKIGKKTEEKQKRKESERRKVTEYRMSLHPNGMFVCVWVLYQEVCEPLPFTRQCRNTSGRKRRRIHFDGTRFFLCFLFFCFALSSLFVDLFSPRPSRSIFCGSGFIVSECISWTVSNAKRSNHISAKRFIFIIFKYANEGGRRSLSYPIVVYLCLAMVE